MTRAPLLARILLVTLLALATATRAHAGPPAAADTLRLEALVAESLRANPEIAAARAMWRAAQEEAPAAGALEDPVIGFMLDDQPVDGSGDGRRVVSLSQAFAFPGKRGLMRREAELAAEVERALARAAVRRVVAEVKAAYFELFMLESQLGTLRESRAALEDVVAGARVRYEVGTGGQQEFLLAMVEASALEGEILTLESQTGAARAKLNLLLDRDSASPLGRAWADTLSPFDATLDGLVAAARAESPSVLARERALEAAETAHRLARVSARPDFMISGGYMQIPKETDEWNAEAAVSLPVWKAGKQDARARAAGRRVDAARSDLDAERNRATAMVEERYARTTSQREVVDLYRRRILPQAELAYRSARANYLSGREMFLVLIEAHRKRIELRKAYYEFFADAELNLARLEEEAGRDLSAIRLDIDAVLEADPDSEVKP